MSFFFFFNSSILNIAELSCPGIFPILQLLQKPFKVEISDYVCGFAFAARGVIVFVYSTAQYHKTLRSQKLQYSSEEADHPVGVFTHSTVRFYLNTGLFFLTRI